MNKLRVVSVQIRDVLGAREFDFEPGQITTLLSRNGGGKSSILGAVQAALGGGSLARLAHVDPSGAETEPEVVPVLEGAGAESYRVERSGEKVRVRARVADTAGFEDLPRPQAWLSGLHDAGCANPVRFLTAPDKDRAILLLEALPLTFDRAALLAEMDVPASDLPAVPPGLHALEELALIRDAVFRMRTGVNRDAKGKAAAAEQTRRNAPAEIPRRLRCGGWRPGQSVLVGARTSRGKSSLLLGCGEAAAAKGLRVLFVPLEMTPEELNAKRLVADAGVSLNALHSWRSADRERVLDALASARPILSRPLDYTGPSTRTLGQIRAACRRQKQRHGLDLVCVDYLQLVRLEGAGRATLYERTTLVSQGLKALAMDLNLAVLCAAQLNREPAGQNGKAGRPSLAHFRDSGSLEQDCDIALLVHQESSRDAIEDGDCELIVAKQRNGWTGSVPLRWRAACARFESRADEGNNEWRR